MSGSAIFGQYPRSRTPSLNLLLHYQEIWNTYKDTHSFNAMHESTNLLPIVFPAIPTDILMVAFFRHIFSLVLALTVTMSSPSAATGAAASPIAARGSVPWQARHGMTSSQYQTTFDELVKENYRLTCVSGYSINNDPRFAAIWEQSPGPDWVARHGMTSDAYQEQFNLLVGQGYRLVLVDGYTISGEAQFAAIWDKSSGPAWVARHNLTSSQFQQAFDNYVSQGYRLKIVSGYAQGNVAYYAALWEQSGTNVTWVARDGMTSSDYQNFFNTYVADGYRLLLVSGYVVNNVDYYAAIWDKSPSGPWVARHGLTSEGYQTEFNKWVGQGYRLTVVSGYTLDSDQDRYAAIWYKE